MALKLTVSKNIHGQQVDFINAYHRIEHIEGDKSKLYIKVVTYTSDKSHQIDSKFYKFSPSEDDGSSRWDKQGYEYLKSIVDFYGAKDI